MSKPFLAGRPYKNRRWANLVHGSEFANLRLMISGGLPSRSLPIFESQNGNEGKRSAKHCLYNFL